MISSVFFLIAVTAANFLSFSLYTATNPDKYTVSTLFKLISVGISIEPGFILFREPTTPSALSTPFLNVSLSNSSWLEYNTISTIVPAVKIPFENVPDTLAVGYIPVSVL